VVDPEGIILQMALTETAAAQAVEMVIQHLCLRMFSFQASVIATHRFLPGAECMMMLQVTLGTAVQQTDAVQREHIRKRTGDCLVKELPQPSQF
jgi:hypothetical protein